MLDDYLIERIAKAKNRHAPAKILLKTLYEKTGITTTKQRQRAPDKIKRYLDHYQRCGEISRYTIDQTSITVYFQ